MRPIKWTNPREILAFVVMEVARIVGQYALAITVLAPIYRQLIGMHGAMWISFIGFGVTTLVTLIGLPLFLGLRAGFGGAPEIVAGPARERAFTTSGPEVGAYLLTSVIVSILALVNNIWIVPYIYLPLRAAGLQNLVLPVSFSISAAYALIFLLIFIALRRGFSAGSVASLAVREGVAMQPRPPGPTDFFGAVGAGFANYAVFSGRARRPEYWYWVLFQVLLMIVLVIADVAAFGRAAGVLSGVASLVLFLPSLAVTVRRLHDIGNSGWWALLPLLPLLGGIILIVMECQPGTEGANRFGPSTA